MQKIYMGSF